MSEVKWISIATDVFNDEKMCAIESLQDGLSIELVWFKILCLAGTCNENGFLMISRDIPYTDEMMAKHFRLDVGIIQRALDVFQKMGMIEIVDDIYMVSNWLKYQNNTELSHIREVNRLRQQRYRDNQKALMNIGTCQYCGQKATGFDHIIPIARGGSDKNDNKVPCCIDCNRIKNDKPLVDFLNSNRDRIQDDIVMNNPILNKMVELKDGQYRYVTMSHKHNVTCHDFCSICNMSYVDVYKIIINYLNTKSNKNYKYSTKKTQALIHARCEDGYTIDDFKKVIDIKCADWVGTEWEQYLRPETLFGNKFEGYLNQPKKVKEVYGIDNIDI